MSKSIYLKLSALAVDDANVRKTGVKEGLVELKASIVAHGLLQPLLVRKQGKKFAVTAGQRRFYALQALQKDGTLANDYEVHCMETDASEEATEISLAENTMRLQMHPADQFEAFSQLAANGMDVAGIAARFGYAESTVQKLLKLARVSPKIIDSYRAGELNLEQVQAFACTDDHDRQEEVFADIDPEYAEPEEIRDALTPEGDIPSTDKRAIYVGIEAYTKAGGNIRGDLFTETTFFLDADLLDKLAAKKLTKSEKKIAAEGWSWVEVTPDLPYETRNKYGRIYDSLTPLSPKLQIEYDALSAEAGKLESAWYDSEYKQGQVLQSHISQEVTIFGSSVAGSRCHGEVKEVAVQRGQVASVDCASQHGVTEQFAGAQEFFPPAPPAVIHYG